MPLRVDLEQQVRGLLGPLNGGLGNDLAMARSVVKACRNGTGSTLARGTVVRLKGSWDDTRVVACDEVEDTRVLGVVVGSLGADGTAFVDADVAATGTAAVMTSGTCRVRIDGAVTRGDYAYVSSTAGQARSLVGPPKAGVFGVFQASASSGSALVVLGSPIVAAMGALEGGVDVVLDGGGTALTTGVKLDLVMPYQGVFTAWDLLADQTGSIVLDLWRAAYADFPPTVADSITGSDPPTIASGTKDRSSALTGWTTAFAKGDVVRVDVESVATVERVTLHLATRRT